MISNEEAEIDEPLPPLQPRTVPGIDEDDIVRVDDADSHIDLTEEDDGGQNNNVNSVSGENDGIIDTSTSSNVAFKRKKTSPVWNCITEDKLGAKCNYCDTIFKLSQGSTSNALRHLTTKHDDIEEVKTLIQDLKENEKAKRKKIDDALQKSSSQPKLTNFVRRKGVLDNKKKKSLDEALVKYIVRSNHPFTEVENPGLRKVLFIAEPNYIVPSATTIKRSFDVIADEIEKSLKNEIQKDIKEAGTMTVHLMSDHGTSSDVLRTKKNVVVLSRLTKDYVLKTDTIAMIKSEGSQTGLQIRKDVKEALVDKVGYDSTWKVCWVTDGAAAEVSARKPGNHMGVGLYVHFDGTCIDHKLDLCGKDALKGFQGFNDAVEKMKTFVNFLSSSSIARQAMYKLMVENNMNPLRTVKGTSNRFFSKWFEADRFIELRLAVELFFEEYHEIPDYCSPLDNNEWNDLKVYRDTLQLIVKASEAKWVMGFKLYG